VVSALFLDIRSAFQCVLNNGTQHEKERCAERIYRWIVHKCQDATQHSVDGFELEAFPPLKDLTGMPLSGWHSSFTTLTC